jgi:hypothetical protein
MQNVSLEGNRSWPTRRSAPFCRCVWKNANCQHRCRRTWPPRSAIYSERICFRHTKKVSAESSASYMKPNEPVFSRKHFPALDRTTLAGGCGDGSSTTQTAQAKTVAQGRPTNGFRPPERPLLASHRRPAPEQAGPPCSSARSGRPRSGLRAMMCSTSIGGNDRHRPVAARE